MRGTGGSPYRVRAKWGAASIAVLCPVRSATPSWSLLERVVCVCVSGFPCKMASFLFSPVRCGTEYLVGRPCLVCCRGSILLVYMFISLGLSCRTALDPCAD